MTDKTMAQDVQTYETEPTIEEKRADLHTLVDTINDEDLLVMFVGKPEGEGVVGTMRITADPEGIGQVMEQLAIRLGYMLTGSEESSAKEAYCVGVGAFGGVAKHRMQEYANEVAEAKNEAGGKHVREDVTDDASVSDSSKRAH